MCLAEVEEMCVCGGGGFVLMNDFVASLLQLFWNQLVLRPHSVANETKGPLEAGRKFFNSLDHFPIGGQRGQLFP